MEHLFQKILSKDQEEGQSNNQQQKIPDAYLITLNLFKKVQSQYGIDKVKLVKNLLDSMNNDGNSGRKILHGLTKKDKEESTNKEE